MRGAKVETQGMFSYLSPEQRVPQDHPLRAVRVIVDQSLTERDGHFSRIYIRPWPSFPSPGASPSCLAAASLLQHPLGAAADGADGLQPAVPLVRGSGDGCSGLGTHGFVQNLRGRNVTSHVARKRKGSAIDGRTTRHAGYAMSIHMRRRIESIFGWMKTVGGMRKTRFRGLERVSLHFSIVAVAYNRVRMARLGVA